MYIPRIHQSTRKKRESEAIFESIYDWLRFRTWYVLEQGTREDAVISVTGTLETREDSVI